MRRMTSIRMNIRGSVCEFAMSATSTREREVRRGCKYDRERDDRPSRDERERSSWRREEDSLLLSGGGTTDKGKDES